MHHPKLFGALILSLLPAYNVYLIGTGIPSVDPVHLGFLAFFVFAIAIYAALTIREGARELRALRTACDGANERRIVRRSGISASPEGRTVSHEHDGRR